MSSPAIPRFLVMLVFTALLPAGCTPEATGVESIASPTPTALQTSPPPVLAPITNQPPPPALTSDFIPCSGAPRGQTITPAAGRLLVAYSNNGLDFHRPTDPLQAIVTDGAGVPDAVILPSGRILIYYVRGCQMENGATTQTNDIVVAVSDQQAQPGSWIFKNVQINGLPSEYGSNPVDPNVVLLPDGSLSLFTTVFSNGNEYTAAFISTDGGFTFSFRRIVYSEVVDPEQYRFNETNWQIITGGPQGIAKSADGGDTFVSLGVFQQREGAVHEIAVTDLPGEYRLYFSSPQGITSYVSTISPWAAWSPEPGYRLQVDEEGILESCHLSFPTVIKRGPGDYLMFYLAVIPGCGCSDDPICD